MGRIPFHVIVPLCFGVYLHLFPFSNISVDAENILDHVAVIVE